MPTFKPGPRIGAAMALAAALLTSCRSDVPPPKSPSDRNGRPAPSRPGVESYSAIVDKLVPAVLTIRSEKRVRPPRQFPFPFPFDFPFGPSARDFGQGRGRGQGGIQRALGSGIIVTADGHCLTNHHVVDGAESIHVELTDGRSLPAKLLGSDAPSDLAVLAIDARGLPVLPLGDSDSVRVGDVALAAGNPLGVGLTVTMGIISAKGRTTGLSDGSFEDFLQTDAAINQGNSGGPLVNTNAELIGINSQIVSTSGGNIGIGFAIPSNMARTVMDQLVRTGKVRRGQLGVGVQRVTPAMAAAMGLKEPRGLLINSVTPGGPADRAGLRRGDVIVAIDGQPVTEGNAFRNRIAGSQPGTEVKLTLLRDGKEQQFSVKLGEFQMPRSGDESGGGQQGEDRGKLGLALAPLTPDLAAQLGVPRGASGVVVTALDPAGPAAEAGIQPGDLLMEVNRKAVRSPADVSAELSRSAGRPLLLLLQRGGQTFFVTVEPHG